MHTRAGAIPVPFVCRRRKQYEEGESVKLPWWTMDKPPNPAEMGKYSLSQKDAAINGPLPDTLNFV